MVYTFIKEIPLPANKTYTYQRTLVPPIDKLRLRQKGRHFEDDISHYILLNENVWIPIKISLKYVRKGPINNIPLVQILMA